MATYRVTGRVTISTYTTVEAATADEAHEIAESRGFRDLCFSCGSEQPGDETWVVSAIDGEPEVVEVEAA